jgi:hypothetical protein
MLLHLLNDSVNTLMAPAHENNLRVCSENTVGQVRSRYFGQIEE